jgi:phosphoglycolate phosphatase-like HAD superfamily hydrolase
MDGVLFDTESVKLDAFVDAFAPLCPDAAARERVHAYNAAHRGIPRSQKIHHVLSALLNLPEDRQDEVAARYATLLEHRLPGCPPLQGLREFLDTVPAVRYVASSAPEPEIRGNLRRHGLDNAFAQVYGHPYEKTEALLEITHRHRPRPVLFFGDAPADLAAARAAGAAFVAINPNHALAELVQGYFDDFTGIDQRAIDQLCG